MRWAQDKIGDGGLYAVALVAGGGLTWLVGMDANDTPADDDGRARLAAMEARRGKRIVNP